MTVLAVFFASVTSFAETRFFQKCPTAFLRRLYQRSLLEVLQCVRENNLRTPGIVLAVDTHLRLLSQLDVSDVSHEMSVVRSMPTQSSPVFSVLLIVVLILDLPSLRTTESGFKGGYSHEASVVPGAIVVNCTGTAGSSGTILRDCSPAIFGVGPERMVFATSVRDDTKSVRVLVSASLAVSC